MSTYANDTAFVEVLSSVLADVRNITSEFFHTALSFANVESVFIHVNRSKDVLTHHTLVEHDSVLIVVTLPRHVCHLEVATDSKFTTSCRVTLSEDIALLHTLTLVAHRTKVDSGALVGLAELRKIICLNSVVE